MPNMAVDDQELIFLGKVTRPHGVNGFVAVILRLDNLEILDALKDVYLVRDQGRVRSRLVAWRPARSGALLLFQGTDDRNAAEALVGSDIYIHPDALPRDDPNDIYLDQLPGYRVILPDGVLLGHIREVIVPAGQEIWLIVTDSGQEVMFPAEPEFVLNIDQQNRLVRIAPPDGLLEIYLS